MATITTPAPCVRIRFVTASGFVSSAIRWMTNSLFSHVEFGTPEGTWIGAHDDGGIQERLADYCTCTREYYYEIPCTPPEMAEHLRRIRTKVNRTPYNFAAIGGIALRRRAWGSRSNVGTVARDICSQFCTEELLEIWGPKKVLNVQMRWAYLVTPEMLHLSPILAGNLKRQIG